MAQPWLYRCHACIVMRRHQMETFSALLALCAGYSPVIGEFPAQRPVTRSFDVFFDLRKRLCKQSWGWWFETPSRSLWPHRNGWNQFTLYLHVFCSCRQDTNTMMTFLITFHTCFLQPLFFISRFFVANDTDYRTYIPFDNNIEVGCFLCYVAVSNRQPYSYYISTPWD